MTEDEKEAFLPLVDLLLNREIEDSSRDDAAMDLSVFNDTLVEKTLLKIASNTDENEMVADSCGESLAAIWVRNNKFDLYQYNKLTKPARFAFKNYINNYKSEWIEKYNLNGRP